MTETGKITVTTAKPLAGKKVFYFIQSIHADLGSAAILPAYRTDGTLTLGAEIGRASCRDRV